MKNTRSTIFKVSMHIVIALCMTLASLYINPSEVQASVSEKKLYMDFLSKEEKRMRAEECEDSTIVSYRLIDLNNDGKKELIYHYWNGGVRSYDRVCMIKKGKAEAMYDADGYDVFGQVSYTIKGSKKKLVTGYATGAFDYWYDVFIFSHSKIKKICTYHLVYESNDVCRYYKDDKYISKQSFFKLKKKLKEIKKKDYH